MIAEEGHHGQDFLRVKDLRIHLKTPIKKGYETKVIEERRAKRLRLEKQNRNVSTKRIKGFKPNLKDVLSILKRIPSFNLRFSEK